MEVPRRRREESNNTCILCLNQLFAATQTAETSTFISESPLNMRPRPLKSIWSEQLKTTIPQTTQTSTFISESPLNMRPRPLKSIWSEQLKTTIPQTTQTSTFTSQSPLNMRPRPLKSIWSEQLKTTTYLPRALPMSLTVSVLPVPAGPAGAPPIDMPRAWASVM